MANPPEETTKKNWRWFKSYQYKKQKDSASDASNVLLIVAALITAITFQAGVTPPGGMWQENENGHTAGRAIYATHQEALYVFLISNTLALSSAVFVIVSLTYSFPFRCEIWIATISMLTTYGSAVFAVTPDESVKFRYILSAAAVPFMLRLFWEIFSRCRVRLSI